MRQQRVRAEQVMLLSSGQLEGHRVAEGVDHGIDFGAQPAFTVADRLKYASK